MQLLLQSACTSCRHIHVYDWNIVACDVKHHYSHCVTHLKYLWTFAYLNLLYSLFSVRFTSHMTYKWRETVSADYTPPTPGRKMLAQEGHFSILGLQSLLSRPWMVNKRSLETHTLSKISRSTYEQSDGPSSLYHRDLKSHPLSDQTCTTRVYETGTKSKHMKSTCKHSSKCSILKELKMYLNNIARQRPIDVYLIYWR